VKVGVRTPGIVEILTGLRPGDQIARSGNLRLSPGKKLILSTPSPRG
jgi:hypothetical protein